VAVVGALIIAFDHLKESVGIAGKFETLQTRLAMVSHSMEDAKHKLEELDHFAASNALELPQVVQASMSLDKFTKGALAGKDVLKFLGDAAIYSGSSIDEVGNAVAMLYAGLKAGAPVTRAVSALEHMGVISVDTAHKVDELSQITNKGGRDFTRLWSTVVSEMSTANGAMELRMTTWEGMVSKLKIEWEDLHRVMGEPVMQALKPLVEDITHLFEGWKSNAQGFGQTIGQIIIQLQAMVRVLGTDGGFGLALRAAADTFNEMLDRGITALGMVAMDWMTRAGKALISTLEVLGTSAFWGKMGNALMEIGKTFVKSLGKDLAALWEQIKGNQPMVLSPLYKSTALMGPPQGKLGAVNQMSENATRDTKPLGFMDAYNAARWTPTKAQADYAERIKTATEEITQIEERAQNYKFPGVGAGSGSGISEGIGGAKASAAGMPSEAEVKRLKDLAADAMKVHEEFAAKGDFSKITSQLSALRDAGMLTTERLSQAHKELDTEFSQSIQRVTEMHDRGMITMEEFDKKVEDTKVNYIKAINDMANLSPFDKLMRQWADLKTQSQQMSVDIANSLSNNLTSGLTALVTGTKSAKDAFNDMAKGIILDIVQMTIKLMIQYAIQSALGMVTGKSFAPMTAASIPAGVHHTGGTVGGGGATRSVSAAAFTGAAHFRFGGVIASGERPIIAEAGEQVLTRDQAKDIKSRLNADSKPQERQRQQNVTILNVMDMRQVDEHLANNPGVLLNVMSRHAPKIRRMMNGNG
jgi:hypothetical protein